MPQRLTKARLMHSKTKKQKARVSPAHRLAPFLIKKNQAPISSRGATTTVR